MKVVRFLNAVSRVRTVFLVPMVLVLLLGIWLEVQNPGSSDTAVISLVVLQLLAVSNGFSSPARRGFYDPVLQRAPRRTIAAAHFACSAAPGVFLLVALGVVETVAGGAGHALAFRTSSWVAIGVVSAVAWAISLWGGSFSGGGIWLLVSIGVSLSGRGLPMLAIINSAARGEASLRDVVGVALTYPMSIPSLTLSAAAVAILGGVAGLALFAGVEYVARAEFPIREERG